MIAPTDADRAAALAEYRRRRRGHRGPPYAAMRDVINTLANVQMLIIAEGGHVDPAMVGRWAAARCYETWMLRTGGYWTGLGRRPA